MANEPQDAGMSGSDNETAAPKSGPAAKSIERKNEAADAKGNILAGVQPNSSGKKEARASAGIVTLIYGATARPIAGSART